MERRKSMLVTQFEAIKEEKTIVHQNLEIIVNIVFSCVEGVKNVEDIKHKNLTQILSLEFDVLKKLADFNYQLESLIENRLPMRSNERSFCETLVAAPDLADGNLTEQSLDLSNKSAENVITSSVSELAATISAEFNREALRENLRKLSEKLGLSEQGLSTMTNYYEKPSNSCIREFYDKPSTSSISCFESETRTASEIEVGCDNFQIPEKDFNTSNFSNHSNNISVNSIKETKHDSLDVVSGDMYPIIGCSTVPSKSIPLVPEESSSDTEEELLKTLRNTSHTSPESTESEEESDKNINQPNAECKLNNSNPPTSTSGPENCGQMCSALQKMNNYKQKVDVIDIEPLVLPDLTLKPAKLENALLNNFEELKCQENRRTTKKSNKRIGENSNALEGLHTAKNKTESKTKKKRKVVDSSSVPVRVIYEMKPKHMPAPGDQCAFSHIESPSEFYIHMVDEETTVIDQLSDKIKLRYGKTLSRYSKKKSAKRGIQRYCLVYHDKHENWFRGEVLNWYLDSEDDNVLVQLVDYGDKYKTSFKNLRKMNEEFSETPMLAIRCHLVLMYPPNSTHMNRLTDWPKQSLDYLMQVSNLYAEEEEDNKFFHLAFAVWDYERNSLAVDLCTAQTNGKTIGEIILDLDLAVQIIEEFDEDNQDLEVFLQDTDELEKYENINEIITGYDARDEARICRFTKADGTCYKGKNCKLEHVPLSKDGFTTDREMVFKEAMYDLLLPTYGEFVMVLVTRYIDACQFFVQIVRKSYNDKGYVVDEDFHYLLETMNSPKLIITYEPFKIAPAIGEIVLAKHWSKTWLRAVVRDFTTGDDGEPVDIRVFFVDYGDQSRVSLSNLRKIRPDFLQLPFQACLCYIQHYKMKSSCPPEEAKKFFLQNIHFHNFIAEVHSVQLPLKINLLSLDRSTDIGKSLQEHGFAEKRISDCHPTDGCSLELY